MQQIQKNSTVDAKKNIINRISDVPGGCSLVKGDLRVGSYLPEATPLTKPTDGKRTVCKQAKLLAGSTTTALIIETNGHQFKVGEFVGDRVGGKAYAIDTVTDNGDGTTTLVVGTAIDAAAEGSFIYEMAAESATNTSALKNTPEVILKATKEVPEGTTVILIADALIRADIHASSVGPAYLATLPGVIEVNY